MLIELGVLRAVIRDVYIPAKYHDEISSLVRMERLCSNFHHVCLLVS